MWTSFMRAGGLGAILWGLAGMAPAQVILATAR